MKLELYVKIDINKIEIESKNLKQLLQLDFWSKATWHTEASAVKNKEDRYIIRARSRMPYFRPDATISALKCSIANTVVDIEEVGLEEYLRVIDQEIKESNKDGWIVLEMDTQKAKDNLDTRLKYLYS